MLDLFRRKKRGLKWILWIVILGLTAGMVLLFVDTPTGVGGTMGSQNVALVDGKTITGLEFRRHHTRLYEVYRQVYRLDEQDPNFVRQLGIGQQALDQLINDYAIWSEAERMGLEATAEEIAERIARSPAFQENGRFIGLSRYEELLRHNNYTTQEFEQGIRRDILREKLENILTDGIAATAEEVQQEFLQRNQEARIRYAAFDPAKLAPAQQEEKELQAYFEKNKESYRIGEERKVRYVSAALQPLEVTLSEDQIRLRMPEIPERTHVRASHILIRVDQDRDEETARKKAQEILDKIRSGADFAELARQNSHDPGSAPQGGDLRLFPRGQMDPEFEQAAFSLQAGEVSNLVQTAYGFHIIKVTETPVVSAEERRQKAESELRQEEAERLALNLANKLAYELRKNANLAEVAQRHGLSVQETGYFGIGDPVPGLSLPNQFNRNVFTLTMGQATEPHSAGGAYVVAQLADIKKPELPAFEQVRSRVAEDFKTRRGEELAREHAYNFHKLLTGADFEETARKGGWTVTTTGFFKKDAHIDDTLTTSQEVHDRVFGMQPGQNAPPLQIGDKYVVAQLIEKSPFDAQKFEQEKERLAKELTQQKRSRFFSTYVQNVVERLRAEKKIIINQPLVDSITG